MMSQQKDTQSRKWLLTINNPIEHGLTHDKIKEILGEITAIVYYCMSDEQGLEEQTPHTHLYIHCEAPKRFSTIKNAFPPVHIDPAKGTAKQNRDYIAKEGKWADDEKHGTKIEGTFEEWGEMPIERQGKRVNYSDVHEDIKAGFNNAELYEKYPSLIINGKSLDQARQDIRFGEYRTKWRDLYVEYIYGNTGVGKTKHVYELHGGYGDVYHVLSYKNPFDRYCGESVIMLDEFRSSLPITDMLGYLDGYPISLPSRYSDKQACFTTVYIVSNIPLCYQYPNIQRQELETWRAFLRRINKLYEFTPDGKKEWDIREHLNDYTSNRPPPELPLGGEIIADKDFPIF